MKRTQSKYGGLLPVVIFSVLGCLVGILSYAIVGTKYITLLSGALLLVVLLRRSLASLWNRSTLLLLAFVVFSGLTAIWAMSGKFFLREYSKIFTALLFFVWIVTHPKRDSALFRRILLTVSTISALYALISVELASTGLCKRLLGSLMSLEGVTMGFIGRLSGIFGNANIEASISALGILAALGLLQGAQSKRERVMAAVLCALSAYAFLLGISVGATVSFALSVVVFLFAAGKRRTESLLHMVFVAVPAAVFAVAGMLAFRTEGSVLPLLLMVVAAVAAALLESFCFESVAAKLSAHPKLPLVFLGAVAGVVVAFAVASVNLTGPYTFSGGEELFRGADPGPGQHTLELEADGAVSLHLYSQNTAQSLQSIGSTLYQDVVSGPVSFSVPEDSNICYFVLRAEPGVTVSSVRVDGEKLPLRYTLLPDSVAVRLQGGGQTTSFLLRKALWGYGLELFRMSPAIGNGVGAFETGLFLVSDLDHATRYVHNHYIQVLLEGGVIGFVLYLAALLSLVWALWKKRALAEDETVGWLYPCLCAGMTMLCAVTLWDVSMSHLIVVCTAYAIYAMVVALCETPLIRAEGKEEAAPQSKREQSILQEKQKKQQKRVRLAVLVLPAVFVVTLLLNLFAGILVKQPVNTFDEFCSNTALAAKIDPYEYNDAKLSYLIGLVTENRLDLAPSGNAYAEELLEEPSNSIPYILATYYAASGQYEQMLRAALRSAEWSAADADTWNRTISLLWTALVLQSSALETEAETLLPLLQEYIEAFDAHQATAIQPIALNEASAGFLTLFRAMVENGGTL